MCHEGGLVHKEHPNESVECSCGGNPVDQVNCRHCGDLRPDQGKGYANHLVGNQPWEARKEGAEEEAAQAHQRHENMEILRHVPLEVCQQAFLDGTSLLGLGAHINFEFGEGPPRLNRSLSAKSKRI